MTIDVGNVVTHSFPECSVAMYKFGKSVRLAYSFRKICMQSLTDDERNKDYMVIRLLADDIARIL